MASRWSSPAGYMLVEVMIALLVVSVGLLGTAVLHLEILRISRGALLRMQAVALAADMAERMRASHQPDGAFDCGGTCDSGAGRTASASADIEAWRTAVAAVLPGGVAEITHEARAGSAPEAYTIRLHWTDAGTDGAHGLQLRIEQ